MGSDDRAPRWERRATERPGEITSAALDLFAERGFAATRLDDVAERAGVSKATIYLYFANKEDLFLAIIRENILPRVERAEALIAAFEGTRADLLRTLILDLGTIVATTRAGAVIKLILSESGNFPQIARYYHDNVIRRGLAMLGRILEDGIAAGEFRRCDPELAAKLVIFPMVMTAVWINTFGERAPLDHEAFLALHADTVLRGLAPEREG